MLIIQKNLLNNIHHPSTKICPITSNVQNNSEILRVHIKKGIANMYDNCDIMIDQISTIDNKRLIKRIGSLPNDIIIKVKENIAILIDLELSTKTK